MFVRPALLLLAWAAPAEPQPDRVGVVWHRQATVSTAAQQRLRAEVARELGVEEERVVADALRRAQRLVAYELDPNDARDLADLTGRLEAATALFRGGEVDLARQQASAVLERLRRTPHLPGASRLAWQTHVLFARIAWTTGDTPEAEAALRRAVVLDPAARLSTRRVPPDLAALYNQQRDAVLARRDAWKRPDLDVDLRGAQVELDGRVGMRPLPAGEHFVVVRWLGAAPAATMIGGAAATTLSRPSTRIASGLPVRGPAAQQICEKLDLEHLVLARVRKRRLGLQAYRCGGGFGKVWYSDGRIAEEDTWRGVTIAVAVDAPRKNFAGKRSPLLDRKPWPDSAPPVVARPGGPIDGAIDQTPKKKPWFKRAWIWVVVSAVVVGGVTTGAVLGTRDPNRVIAADINDWTN